MGKRQKSPAKSRAPRTTARRPVVPVPPAWQRQFDQFVDEVTTAHARADAASTQSHLPPSYHLDLRAAIHVLETNPMLLTWMQGVRERELARDAALGSDPQGSPYSVPLDLLRKGVSIQGTGRPTAESGDNRSGGAWGVSSRPQGIPNARLLRDWADTDEWVRAAINVRRQQVSRANVEIKPLDERRPYSRPLMTQLQQLLDQPNEYLDSYRSLLEPVVEDILVLDRGCLWGKEPILLADGSTRLIGDIVASRAEVEVLAFNEQTGSLEPKRVTGWYRNQLGGRAWVKVAHTHARNMGRHGNVACWFTDDHQLLTEHGWQQIKDIGPTERVVTGFLAPNERQAALLDGMLLGDSSLELRANSPRAALRTTHSIKQQAWLETKCTALTCFQQSPVSLSHRGRLVRQSAWSHPWLAEARLRWYPAGKKIVPSDLSLTALTVAAWYMDDGHLGVTRYRSDAIYYFAYFNTCGFSYEEQVRLAELLTAWGVEAHVQQLGKYWRIYVTVAGARALFARIAPYVVPELRYKLPPDVPAFDALRWNMGQPVPYLDTIQTTPGNPAGGKNVVPQTTYCIDVADHHNFVASGLVAHNCIEKNQNLRRQPVALYAQDGATIKIYPNWSGDPDEFRYVYEEGAGGNRIGLRNDQMIVISANPATYRFCLSPVQVLRNTIMADLAAMRSAMHVVDMKPPPHMVQIPGAGQTLLRALRNDYETNFAGQKELFFMGGEQEAKVFPLVFSAKDNQWMEWQIWLARKICAAFAISPQMIGITFDINKSTGQMQQQIFEDTGLMPLLLLIEEFLNNELLGDFAPRNQYGRPDLHKLNLRVVYPEISEAARMLHSDRVNALAVAGAQGLPFMTPNQIQALRGEEPFPVGGNTLWIKTATGAVPWLSYDGVTGDMEPGGSIGGDEGAQDPAGGPVAGDGGSDGGGGDNAPNFDDSPGTPAGSPPADDTPSAGNDVGGGEAGEMDTSPAGDATSTARYTPYPRDPRPTGKAWSPALERAAHQRPQPLGRAPTAIAQRPPPVDQVAAEATLSARARAIFAAAARRRPPPTETPA